MASTNLNGIFGGFNLPKVGEDELQSVLNSVQFSRRQKIVEREVLHQRRVVVNRVKRLFKTRIRFETARAGQRANGGRFNSDNGQACHK